MYYQSKAVQDCLRKCRY